MTAHDTLHITVTSVAPIDNPCVQHIKLFRLGYVANHNGREYIQFVAADDSAAVADTHAAFLADLYNAPVEVHYSR